MVEKKTMEQGNEIKSLVGSGGLPRMLLLDTAKWPTIKLLKWNK